MLGPEAYTINVSTAARCPPDTDVPDALAAIRQLLLRHDSLRTRYVRDGPDGETHQLLDGAGAATVLLIPVTGDDLDQQVAQVRDQLRASRFALADEWPGRFAVLTAGRHARAPARAPARAIVFAGSHLVCDGSGLIEMREELARLGRGGPPPGVQPLDQAAFESSPAGAAVDERAMRYRRRQLTAMPRTLFPGDPGPAHGSRFWYGRFESPAISAALPLLAREHGVSTSTVLYTATCAVLAANAGLDRCTMGVVAGNRLRAGTEHAIATLSQLVPVTLAVAGDSFEAVLRDGRTKTLNAYRHGAYDPRSAARVTAEVAAERGVSFDQSVWFNDRRPPEGTPPRVPTGPQPPRGGRLRWVAYNDAGDSTFYVYVDEAPGGVSLYVMTDTRHLPPATTERLLAGIERLLAAAAAGGRPALHATQAPWHPTGERWYRIDGSWVNLDGVRRMLDRAGTWSAGAVFIRDGRLVAHLVPAEGTPTPEAVHVACLAALADHPSALAPQLYTIHPEAPDDPGDPLAWRRVPVIAEGSGRPSPGATAS